MSIRDQAWWSDAVRRLRTESLSSVAVAMAVEESALMAGLVQGDRLGAAQKTEWWPELLRQLRAGGAIRDLARRFQTNPRRIRRALARSGERVGGRELGGRGLALLDPHRDALGKEPDGDIARRAGVTAEAVAGERRRLGVPAWRPPPRLRVEPPPPRRDRPPLRKARPERPWQRSDGFEPQIIRRPTSSRLRDADLPPGLPEDAPRAADEAEAPGWRSRTWEEGPEVDLGGDSSSRSELRGRKRLIRPDQPREELEPAASPRPARSRKPALHGEVRVIEVAPEPEVVRRPGPAAAGSGLRPLPPRPAASLRAPAVPPAPPPAPAVLPPAPALAAAAPAPRPRGRPRKSGAPVQPPSVAPAPPPAPVALISIAPPQPPAPAPAPAAASVRGALLLTGLPAGELLPLGPCPDPIQDAGGDQAGLMPLDLFEWRRKGLVLDLPAPSAPVGVLVDASGLGAPGIWGPVGPAAPALPSPLLRSEAPASQPAEALWSWRAEVGGQELLVVAAGLAQAARLLVAEAGSAAGRATIRRHLPALA